MKKIFTTIFILYAASIFAADSTWIIASQNQKVFIENKSQFSNRPGLENMNVLFATVDGPVQLLFSKNGFAYVLSKQEHGEKEFRRKENEMTHEEMEARENGKTSEREVVKMQWGNSNPGVVVFAEAEDPAPYIYKTDNGSIKARAYKKIIYRNLYQGIDAEFVFHPLEGIEYSFIIHPGADASQIRMNYAGVPNTNFDKDKNLIIPTRFGDIIDHAPHCFYFGTKNEISSSFVRRGKTVSFKIGPYDHSMKIIIDPWTVTPPMGNSNKVFNIEADSSGNAYVYGGDSPYKLQKYDPSGALQWTFTNSWDSSTYWCGTLITDRAGNSYITAGSSAEITKVNASGTQLWTQTGGLLDEYWSLAFNCDETELIVGGTRLTGLPFSVNGSGRAFNIDLASGNVINSIKVSNAIPSFIINDPNEIRSVCASPNGNYYFLTLDTIGALTPALAGIQWESVSGYRFGYGSPEYGFTPQGQSIIRASATHIYTANGDSVVKRDINTGAIVAAAAIPGGGHATTLFISGTLPKNGGLVIDSCGNVFAGSQNNVTMYDENLSFISSTATPSAVYDVAIGINGDVLACGNGFAIALTIPSCAQIHTSCNTAALPVALFSAPDSICPGTCTDFMNLSQNASTYQWYFPGAAPSVSTDTDPAGICYNAPGSYDVTLVASGASGTDSVTLANYITVYPYPPPQGISQGGDTLYAYHGATTYQWYHDGVLIPGATDYFYVVITGGNFNVVCTDSNNCEVEAGIFDVVAGIATHMNGDASKVKLFPNPAGDWLEITLTGWEEKNVIIKIYEITGRKIYSAEMALKGNDVRKTYLDCSRWASGTYWMEVSSGEKIVRNKIVKQ